MSILKHDTRIWYKFIYFFRNVFISINRFLVHTTYCRRTSNVDYNSLFFPQTKTLNFLLIRSCPNTNHQSILSSHPANAAYCEEFGVGVWTVRSFWEDLGTKELIYLQRNARGNTLFTRCIEDRDTFVASVNELWRDSIVGTRKF